MRRYDVTGMSCAACQARVEKAVGKLHGVKSVSVSLLTGDMTVDGEVSDEEVIDAVEKAGYGASNNNGTSGDDGDREKGQESAKEKREKEEIKSLAKRLISSAVLLLVLMYFSMGYAMWGWKVPGFFDGNPMATALLELLLTSAIIGINFRFFTRGVGSLIHLSPNMDALVAMGSGSAYIYSIWVMFEMTVTEQQHLMHRLHGLYFESAAMILTLITLGKMLEAISKGKTTSAIQGLMKLAPSTATVVTENGEERRPLSEVRVGDTVAVRPGESIPVDGIVIEGTSAVDESALSGESVPVDKGCSDRVSAGTINTSGYLKIKTTGVGEDTTLSNIIKMVRDAATGKAPIAKAADKVSSVFVPAVISIALVTFIVWMAVGNGFSYALARAITVLVISCPCALGLATPVAIMVGSGVGSRNGILFKSAAILEECGKVKTVVLDKTGTITYGEMSVTDTLVCDGYSDEELLSVAYSLEEKSEHPIARAIVAYAKEKSVALCESADFEALGGFGVRCRVNNDILIGGNMKFISSAIALASDTTEFVGKLSGEGKTPILFAKNGKLIGIIGVSDTIKEDSRDAVMTLKDMGLRVVMLTGDNARTANAIARKAGIDEVISDVLPTDKEKHVRSLMKEGKVAMVGDGVNDAPALTAADVGMAIGAGADVAIDAADVVLMKNTLSDVCAAIKLSRATLRNIYENLFWAFIYNAVGIPLAAGVWIKLLEWELNPMFGAAAMSLSSVSVILNALRLGFVNLKAKKKKRTNKETQENNETDAEKSNDNGKDKLKNDRNEKEGEKVEMKVTVKINGMMCGHCESHVKGALEKLDGVVAADVSHERKEAVITLSKDIEDNELKQAITSQGYEVVGIIR